MKNIYKLKEFTPGESYRVEPIYFEGESLKEVFLEYILNKYDFNHDEINVGCINMVKLDIKNNKQKSKNMKNRTILK